MWGWSFLGLDKMQLSVVVPAFGKFEVVLDWYALVMSKSGELANM